MSVETWGQLDKSQSDSEKVEGAIARLIAEHEADPDSHLGSGESLEAHRAFEVIDHKAGSVLLDKMSFTEIIYDVPFETLASWYTTGEVNLVALGCVALHVETYDIQDSLLQSSFLLQPGGFDYTKDLLIQFVGWQTDPENSYFWAVFGQNPTEGNFNGFGFYVLGGVVKGVWGKGVDPVFTDDLNIDVSVAHVFRLFYDAIVPEVRFYVDGVLVATLVDIEPTTPPDLYLTFNLHITNFSAESFLYIQKVLFGAPI